MTRGINGFRMGLMSQSYDEIITEAMQAPPQVLPYTVRELAELLNTSRMTVYRLLDADPRLQRKGKRWVFRHNPPRGDE